MPSLTADLAYILKCYVESYPAFRSKPVGAPDSTARREQDKLIWLEDSAKAAIKAAEQQ